MSEKKIIGLILAAGKGTRMRSNLPKVLHPVLGVPLLSRVVKLLQLAEVKDIVVVIGHGADRVREAFSGEPLRFVVQKQQLGTGHAVSVARDKLRVPGTDVIIMCGDTPLFLPETIKEFISAHMGASSKVSILSSSFRDPKGYGRIIRDGHGRFLKIVEERDASSSQRRIREVNTGTYLVDNDVLFELVSDVDCKNAQGEFYLTDIVELAINKGYRVNAFCLASEEEALGINSRGQLAEAERVLLVRLRNSLMAKGVTMLMPETIYIEESVKIGRDSTVCSHCVLKGSTQIGANSLIGPFCYLEDVSIQEGAKLPPFSIMRGKDSKESCN